MAKPKNFTFRKFFSSNKVLIVISFLIALIGWYIYSATVAPEKTKTITAVPITIDLSDTAAQNLGLTAYGYEDITVDVQVRGKSYVIGSLTKDDLSVSILNLNKIEDAGEKTLQVSVKSKDGSFNVVSVSRPYIQVYFDFEQEKTFEINYEINEPEGGAAADGYYYNGAFYKTETLAVTGPKAEVDRITGVTAKVDVKEQLTKTTTYKAEIEIETTGDAPKYLSYDVSEAEEVTLSVQKTKQLPVKVEFTSVPEKYVSQPLPVSYSLSEVLVAGTDSQVTNLAFYKLGEIDFSELSPQNNVFVFEIETQAGITVIDGSTQVTVTVDMSQFTERTFSIDGNNVNVNLPQSYSVGSVRRLDSIKVVVPESVSDSIVSSLLQADISFSDETVAVGTQEAEVTITVSGRNDCWVVGKYKTFVTVTQ